MSRQRQNEFISIVSLSNPQQAYSWRRTQSENSQEERFIMEAKHGCFFCKLLQKSQHQTTTRSVNMCLLLGIVHIIQTPQLTKPLCPFPLSSWPFSLTDSIQPVALRVTRPLIALVKSFFLFAHQAKTKL